MRVPASPPLRSASFNMTPMIDVVFLLIIFFLVSSHLAQQEIQPDLELPVAASGGPPPPSTPRVTVNLRADGQLLLGSQPVTADELGRRLQHERQRVGRDLEVRLRSDRQVAYRHVEPVLVACAKSGIWNVTFAVVRNE